MDIGWPYKLRETLPDNHNGAIYHCQSASCRSSGSSLDEVHYSTKRCLVIRIHDPQRRVSHIGRKCSHYVVCLHCPCLHTETGSWPASWLGRIDVETNINGRHGNISSGC